MFVDEEDKEVQLTSQSPWSDLQNEMHLIACEKGWWDKPKERGPLVLLMLMITELEECIESFVDTNVDDEDGPYLTASEVNTGEELADTAIRLGDAVAHWKLNLSDPLTTFTTHPGNVSKKEYWTEPQIRTEISRIISCLARAAEEFRATYPRQDTLQTLLSAALDQLYTTCLRFTGKPLPHFIVWKM